MNSKENQIAQQLLDEALNCCRVEPEKAQKLMVAYKTLQEAYAIRVEAEKKEGK